MIKTPDKKEFLTAVKHYPLLIEYANTFGSKLYTVETAGPTTLLEMPELAMALCESEGVKGIKYEVIKKHLPALERASKRRDEQELAYRIRTFIKAQLLKGEPVSLMTIRKHFSKYGLRTCTISNHYAFIRRQLIKQGTAIRRIGHGIYQKTA